MSEQSKLAVLRAKTDRDLWTLVQRQLDRGLTLAGLAATRGSPLHLQAEKAHETVKQLLPKIAGLTPDERKALERRLKELETALDQLPSENALRPYQGLRSRVASGSDYTGAHE